jgi:hypothetical protein
MDACSGFFVPDRADTLALSDKGHWGGPRNRSVFLVKIFASAAIACAALISSSIATPVAAQPRHSRQSDYQWQGSGQNRHWDAANSYRSGGKYRERRLSRNDEIYRGHDGRNYCRRTDGSTGLVIGAIAGGLLGNAIGGDTLGTLLGLGSGAALGRSIDRGQVRCR